MKIYTYYFADGTKSCVEVDDGLYELLKDMDKRERYGNRREHRRTQSLDSSVDNGWDIEDATADVAVKSDKTERDIKLKNAIAALNREQQLLLQKVFVERIPQAEIAKELNIDKTSVRDRLRVIYRKIKKFLYK